MIYTRCVTLPAVITGCTSLTLNAVNIRLLYWRCSTDNYANILNFTNLSIFWSQSHQLRAINLYSHSTETKAKVWEICHFAPSHKVAQQSLTLALLTPHTTLLTKVQAVHFFSAQWNTRVYLTMWIPHTWGQLVFLEEAVWLDCSFVHSLAHSTPHFEILGTVPVSGSTWNNKRKPWLVAFFSPSEHLHFE